MAKLDRGGLDELLALLGVALRGRVDEKTLEAVANETGGRFDRATDTDSLQKIYEQINQYETSAQSVQKFEHVEELYRWALYPALGFLGLGVLLQQTRFRRLP